MTFLGPAKSYLLMLIVFLYAFCYYLFLLLDSKVFGNRKCPLVININNNNNKNIYRLLLSISLRAINAGEGVEKREPSYTVGGNAN